MTDSETFLYENIELWRATDPKHAVLLPYCADEQLQFCRTAQGELNLVRLGEHFHAQQGALQEAKRWLEGQDLSQVTILYIYGVGLGYQYDVLKPWLSEQKGRHVVFLEDDLSVIFRLFETAKGEQLLCDSQVDLFYFQEIRDLPLLLDSLFWHFLKAKMVVSTLPYYGAIKEKKGISLRHEIARESVRRGATVDEYLRYGASFYRNFYHNMRLLPGSYLGNDLFEKFERIPAIICGAGPSLQRNISLLPELTERALIFAGGSAMNALNAQGIIPHFGAGIDPNAMQYDRLAANTAYEVPYFYRNRMFWKAFRLIRGPRLYITGSGGYEVSKWFDQAFGWQEEEIDEGHNVVNFCVEIAKRMGCDPIIFVGVDLAFTEMQAYAEGILADRDVSETELFTAEDFDDIPLEKKDIYGRPIYTLWKWIAESEWISTFASDNPKVTLINATEGGLGFPGVQNLSLEEVKSRFLTRRYDLFGRVHGEVQNASCLQVTEDKMIDLLQRLGESLRGCLGHLQILLEENQKRQDNTFKTFKGEQILSGRAVLAETDLEEEPAYSYILEVFSGVSSLILNYEFHKLKHSELPHEQLQLKKLQLHVKKLKYVKQAAEFNLALLEDALKEKPFYAKD